MLLYVTSESAEILENFKHVLSSVPKPIDYNDNKLLFVPDRIRNANTQRISDGYSKGYSIKLNVLNDKHIDYDDIYPICQGSSLSIDLDNYPTLNSIMGKILDLQYKFVNELEKTVKNPFNIIREPRDNDRARHTIEIDLIDKYKKSNWRQSNMMLQSFRSFNAYPLIRYANRKYVAATDDDGLWWSDYGEYWIKTKSKGPDNGCWKCLDYGNGIWVAGGYSQGLWLSVNGMNWTKAITKDLDKYNWVCIKYANGIWIASGLSDQGIWWSDDGNKWVRTDSEVSKIGCWSYITYANDVWMAVSIYGRGLIYSKDGKTWYKPDTEEMIHDGWKCVAYGNGVWIAGCYDKELGIWYSEDNGRTWSKSKFIDDLPKKFYGWTSIVYANNMWVASNGDGVGLWWSKDGKSWSISNVGNGSWDNITNINGTWFAFNIDGEDGHGILTSKNGKIWTEDKELFDERMFIGNYESIVYHNKRLILCGSKFCDRNLGLMWREIDL